MDIHGISYLLMIWDIDDILMACTNGIFLWDMNGIVWDIQREYRGKMIGCGAEF